VKNGDGQKIEVDHQNKKIGQWILMEALGTADADFANGILKQLAKASTHGQEIDEGELNFMLSVIKGIEPRDQLETMLAAQMADVHMQSMKMAHSLADFGSIPLQDSAQGAFNKLTRTYTTQMEALKRYRTGGEQKVTVQYVSVREGSQAIVGNVTQASRENVRKKAAASPPALTDAKVVPMPTIGEGKEGTAVAVRHKSNE
jgi:hypothetical protein